MNVYSTSLKMSIEAPNIVTKYDAPRYLTTPPPFGPTSCIAPGEYTEYGIWNLDQTICLYVSPLQRNGVRDSFAGRNLRLEHTKRVSFYTTDSQQVIKLLTKHFILILELLHL